MSTLLRQEVEPTSATLPADTVDLRVQFARQLESAVQRAAYDWEASPEVALRVQSRILDRMTHWLNRFGQVLVDPSVLHARLKATAERAIGRELRRRLRSGTLAMLRPGSATSLRHRGPVEIGNVIDGLSTLSPLQWQILYLLGLNYSSRSISNLLRISVNAVDFEASQGRKKISHIYRKLS